MYIFIYKRNLACESGNSSKSSLGVAGNLTMYSTGSAHAFARRLNSDFTWRRLVLFWSLLIRWDASFVICIQSDATSLSEGSFKHLAPRSINRSSNKVSTYVSDTSGSNITPH